MRWIVNETVWGACLIIWVDENTAVTINYCLRHHLEALEAMMALTLRVMYVWGQLNLRMRSTRQWKGESVQSGWMWGNVTVNTAVFSVWMQDKASFLLTAGCECHCDTHRLHLRSECEASVLVFSVPGKNCQNACGNAFVVCDGPEIKHLLNTKQQNVWMLLLKLPCFQQLAHP